MLNEKIQKTWVIYLQFKDEFVDDFQIWLPKVKNKSNNSLKVFYVDRREEFISEKLKGICKKKGIMIKYIAPYIYEENRLMEQGWKTIVTMKNSLLVDSSLPLEFWAKAMDTANYL